MKFWNKFVRSVSGKSLDPSEMPGNISVASFTHKPPTPEPRLAFAGVKKQSEDEGVYSDPEDLLRNRRKSFTHDYVKNAYRSSESDNKDLSLPRSGRKNTNNDSAGQLNYWQTLFQDQQTQRNEQRDRNSRPTKVKSVYHHQEQGVGRNCDPANPQTSSSGRFASLDRNRIFLTRNSHNPNGQNFDSHFDDTPQNMYPQSQFLSDKNSSSRLGVTKGTTPTTHRDGTYPTHDYQESNYFCHQFPTHPGQYSNRLENNSHLTQNVIIPNSEELWYSCYSPQNDSQGNTHTSSNSAHNTLPHPPKKPDAAYSRANNSSFPNFNQFQQTHKEEPIYANPSSLTQFDESSAFVRVRPNSIAESKFYANDRHSRDESSKRYSRTKSQSQELRFAEESHRMTAQLEKSENRKRDLWWEIQNLLTDKYKLQEAQKSVELETSSLRSQIDDFEREIYAMQQAVNRTWQTDHVYDQHGYLCHRCATDSGKLDTSALNDCLVFGDNRY